MNKQLWDWDPKLTSNTAIKRDLRFHGFAWDVLIWSGFFFSPSCLLYDQAMTLWLWVLQISRALLFSLSEWTVYTSIGNIAYFKLLKDDKPNENIHKIYHYIVSCFCWPYAVGVVIYPYTIIFFTLIHKPVRCSQWVTRLLGYVKNSRFT